MTAHDLAWLSAGLAELEAALAAGEFTLARELARFIDKRTGAHVARERVIDALMRGEVAA